MRLAKLTLNGFKSFADRTEFTFDDSITGIVGPNGCGKSNIVDAIKWVLGERSSKSLRGKEMIDVIFAGSAGRKPSGMASVVLTFDNPVLGDGEGADHPDGAPRASEAGDPEAHRTEAGATAKETGAADNALIAIDAVSGLDSDLEETAGSTVIQAHVRGKRTLPIDVDIVAVERRLYRDGTSHYLINSRRARLKDIRELFLDTGVGADAYSIIEQGKVDAMLLASPQERRTIFEEAAGIARYKQRRIESERKLDRAIANLAVTREQLENTERRLRIVKGQAAKARRFREIDGELGAWRTALAFEQYDDLRQRLSGLTSRLRDLEQTRTEASRLLAETEHDKQEAELTRGDAMDSDRRLEQSLTQASHAAERADQRREMAERSVADLHRQRAKDAASLEELRTRSATLENAAKELAEQGAALAEQVGDAQRQLDTATEQRGLVSEQLAAQQAVVAERRAAVTNIDRERAGLTASIAGDERRAEGVREQVARVADRRASLEEDARAHETESELLGDQIDQRQADIGVIARELTGHESSADEMSADRRERARALGELEQQAVRLDSRRQTLQELLDARAGLGDAVREVLQRKERGEGFARVLAPLADLLDANEETAAAVETALGTTLEALVVETVGDLPSSEEIETLPGRVAFVPISRLGLTPRRQVLDTAAMFGQRVTPVRALVRARSEDATVNSERVEALLDRLLGETYLVPDLDAALLLASGPLAGRRMVTEDGCVLEIDGRIIAGPMGAADSSGVLQQRGELVRLDAELVLVRERLHVAREELALVDTQAAELNETMTALRRRHADGQRLLAGETAKFDRLVAEGERLEREHTSLADEAEQTAQRLAKIEADREHLRERAGKLERLQAEEETHSVEAQRSLESIQAERDAMAERLSVARVDVSRLSEQAGSARRDLNRASIDRDEVERHHRDLTQHIGQAAGRAAEYEQEIEESLAQTEQAKTDATRLEGEVANARDELVRCEADVLRLGELVLEARSHAQHIERDWHSLEVSRREIEVKRENLEDRTSEELSLDLPLVYAEYRAMMDDEADEVRVARICVDEAASQVETLRAEVKKLGNVNLDSIEEEQTLADRNEGLITQVADIDEAREQLTDLIEKLNGVCRERFGETFTKIQAEFGGQQGMFRKLFGGGQAEVRLMPLIKVIETPDGPRKVETDETDLLESGIEVIAKPPGKEPRSINQLSGGEKTMTAVALLLSIFRSKPSCFCVLDEVDAALDEANVGRYVEVIRQYTDQSHFIVITHNKRTMQAVDRLYGVTMQERGVSTKVSVKLEREGKRRAETPAPVVEVPESAEEQSPRTSTGSAAAKPSLRAALASLREEQAVEAE